MALSIHLADLITLITKDPAFISTLIAGLFVLAGAFIGALIGAMLRVYFDNRKKRQERQENLQSMLEGISTELETLFDRYLRTMGNELTKLPPDSSLNFYYSTTENYLTIFENNARLLGQLTDKELRKSIICTYINIKGLLDGFKLNNSMYANHEMRKSYDILGTNPMIQDELRKIDTARKDYAGKLKQEHNTLSQQIPELIQHISNTIRMGTF